MHELSIMENVLEVVREHAEGSGAVKVLVVNLEVGALSDIVPEFAQMFFDLIAKGTIAENARIVIEKNPAKIKCAACKKETEMTIDNLLFACPACNSDDIKLISGREFRVNSIEIE